MEPQKDAPVYGAFGSALFVFGRANGKAAIDLQRVIFENLAVFALNSLYSGTPRTSFTTFKHITR